MPVQPERFQRRDVCLRQIHGGIHLHLRDRKAEKPAGHRGVPGKPDGEGIIAAPADGVLCGVKMENAAHHIGVLPDRRKVQPEHPSTLRAGAVFVTGVGIRHREHTGNGGFPGVDLFPVVAVLGLVSAQKVLGADIPGPDGLPQFELRAADTGAEVVGPDRDLLRIPGGRRRVDAGTGRERPGRSNGAKDTGCCSGLQELTARDPFHDTISSL